ncbi:MAG: nicotinate phosphoribosyltransferase [Balneolaceae bacterium]|nr:nicotinate phosphoribosyltransferase [Balneolaceae bacterium]
MKLPNPSLYTDFYELTMAEGYFLSGRHQQTASFDYFFRKLPFEGGYVIYAGLGDLLEIIEEFTFSESDLNYLKEQGFKDEFLKYLSTFKFQGDIYSVKEGEIVFPNETVLRVEGTIVEAQIIETALLNFLNFESLIATKASRIKQSAEARTVLDFGLRRSQGTGGLQASKAAIIGGLEGSSNVLAGQMYGIPVSGTMAHSWVQSFEDEITAFRTFVKHFPDSSVLLVDTYDTLKSGIPNAIQIGKELEAAGNQLKAIRLDSGDLAYFAKKSRELLDTAGLDYVKIVASNQLDEHVIKSLIHQGAPIDMFGVGTKLVTAYDNPALDGVYKLSSFQGESTLKVSENVEKITLPGIKRTVRFLHKDGSFRADGILLEDDSEVSHIYHPHYPSKHLDVSECAYEELLHQFVEEGRLIKKKPTVSESAHYAKTRFMKLKEEHRRFNNPHVYKVGISKKLQKLRNQLIQNLKQS